MTEHPMYIRKQDVPAVFGLSERQLKRWSYEGRLNRFYPGGPTGPCFFKTADLEALMERSMVPVGKKAGRAPKRAS
ncbi:hypothetical protein [Nocardioides pinisoli]|uniref:DNA-binding protein n=1 Tax=Nocardioides pinisoli TaxID=2950279 RepID=A0ABT1KYZ0_9ACTN|nr:hypothetical protein [Nocardioides pinisoli]MCP3422983.1 hypothetical protein [Nocardioides pinisoli]